MTSHGLPRRARGLAFACLLGSSLLGCHSIHVGTQDGGPDPGSDAGPTSDSGANGEPCGPVTCTPGLFCCNASCGICAAPGEACIELACAQVCSSNGDCTADEYCALPQGTCPGECALPEGCPAPPEGVCTPRAGDCPAVFSPVCGCDGLTYSNGCAASAAGVTVAHDGECGAEPCAAMDARAEGECEIALGWTFDGGYCRFLSGCECVGGDCGRLTATELECVEARQGCSACGRMDASVLGPECDFTHGYAWNGVECAPVTGCNCIGVDCTRLYTTSSACLAAQSHCSGCGPMDAFGEGECAAFFGYAWNGVECVGLSGCDCVGADCGRTYDDPGACEGDHASCVPPGPCLDDADCGAARYCHYAAGECGGSGDPSGECRPFTGADTTCPSGAPVVCGCDGVTYPCEASASSHGTSVRSEGACAPGGACDPMDARGEGLCLLALGVRWTGTECEGIGGCSCAGADCDRLYPGLEECAAAHDGCDQPPGETCGTIAGLRCRPDEWCDFVGTHWCGGADAGGLCRPRPDGCTLAIDPVCGCDGTVYDNECLANMAGWDVTADPSPSTCTG